MAATPETAAIEHELAGADRELIGALQQLPSKQRQAVAYHYLGGLPYAEVAAILGGTASAARRAAADAIANLRRTFAGAGSTKRETDEH